MPYTGDRRSEIGEGRRGAHKGSPILLPYFGPGRPGPRPRTCSAVHQALSTPPPIDY